jgi:GNAT superfamily N-acetyltransferase
MTSTVEIITGYIPGSIGRIVELHGKYYHEHWDFGSFFEAKVATELSEFVSRYNHDRDCFWTASLNGRIEGSITIDGIHAQERGAHLRWFIVSDLVRGIGVGSQLIKAAIEFCRDKKYERVYLWTFEGLEPARHLYEKFRFKCAEQRRGIQWGTEVNEQRFELKLF